jgi:hypothetical protein
VIVNDVDEESLQPCRLVCVHVMVGSIDNQGVEQLERRVFRVG